MLKNTPKLLTKRRFVNAPGGHCRFAQEPRDRLLLQKELNPKIGYYRPDKPAVPELDPTPHEAMSNIFRIRRIQRLRSRPKGKVRDER